MNETLHIFAKDTRRFWPEIAISVALLAAFGYVLPLTSHAQPYRDASLILYSVLKPILYVLIPISWWVLTSRVVHEENLVGDRQFWITRPYRWPSLLAAKTLFLAAYVLAPIGLMQAAVLASSGFHVAFLVPGILFSVMLIGMLVILPLAALSTVTPSFAKLTVTLLAIVIVVLIVESLLIPRAVHTGFTPHAGWIYFFITFAACAAIVILQYARRRTLIARVLLAATIVLLMIWSILFPTALMPLYFHSISGGAANTVVHPDPGKRSGIAPNSFSEGSAEYQNLGIAVIFSGLGPDALVDIEAKKIDLTTASGLRYSGPWRSVGSSPDISGASEVIQFSVPKSFLDKVRNGPVTVAVRFGVAILRSGATTSIPFPASQKDIPGIGICSPNPDPSDNDGSSYGLACTSALRSSQYIFVTARWSDIACRLPQPTTDQLIPGTTYTGSFDSDVADFGLSPLVPQPVSFSNATVQLPNNAVRQRYLCPGTPLTFTPYVLAGRTSVVLNLPEMRLDEIPSNGLDVPDVAFRAISPSGK